MDRREFLRLSVWAAAAAGLPLGARLLTGCRAGGPAGSLSPAPPGGPDQADRKLIVVLFGGGTRSSESIDDPQHRWIPRLWNHMVPRGTLFTNMRVEGKVVHPNSAGSILTG